DAMSAKPDKNTAIGPPLKSLSEIKGAHFWFYG
ncbi:Os02g0584300, partial [Oryza sativa Japonica Group]